MNMKPANRSPLHSLFLPLLGSLLLFPTLGLAKVGEQENWYLAEEIELDELPNRSMYFKDSQNGNEYIFGTNGYSLTKLDL